MAEFNNFGYCEAAEFFDEQPVGFGTVIKQRMRWFKGRLYAFFAYAHQEIAGMFKKKTQKWACFDMLFYAFPYGLVTTVISLAVTALSVALAVQAGTVMDSYGPLATLKSMGMDLLSFWLMTVFRSWN